MEENLEVEEYYQGQFLYPTARWWEDMTLGKGTLDYVRQQMDFDKKWFAPDTKFRIVKRIISTEIVEVI